MAVSTSDPSDFLLNNIQVALSPLESNFRKVAENFYNCFSGFMKKGKLNVTADDIATNGGKRVFFNVDDRKMGKLPITKYLQIFTEKCTSNFECDRDEKVNNGVNGKANCFRFELALSIVINGFVRAFFGPFKSDNMGLRNMNGNLMFARVAGGTQSSLLSVTSTKDVRENRDEPEKSFGR